MTLARFFEAPEGRWTLASEFAAEDAANQLQPHIARDVSGDDLCAGASGAEAHHTPSSPAPMRMGAAGTAMVTGGFMFGDARPATAFPSSTTPAATAPPKSSVQNNRPTGLSVVRTGAGDMLLRGAADGLSETAGKSVVTKSSSSFVGRLVASDSLARWALSPTPTLLFTAPRALIWTIASSLSVYTLLRLDLLTSTPLCHDTRCVSAGHVDVVAGFMRGHMLLYDAPGARYSRINKAGKWRADVRCVAWVPGKEWFVAGGSDGWLVLVDREVEEFSAPGDAKGGSNPVACWRLSRHALTSVSFAPQGTVAAVTSDDGNVYLVDIAQPSGSDTPPFASSYFGALTCCAWSPDGTLLVCGGKDDLLSVWSSQGSLVARCHGHGSWVRKVVFDEYSAGDGEALGWRFVSVGDDGRVCLWELSLAALHRPRVGRAQVPVLLPLGAAVVHEAPVTALAVARDALVTACRRGIVRVWRRPEPQEDAEYV